MEFRADAVIDNSLQSSTVEHSDVVFVLEALDLGARNALRHRFMPHIY